MKKEDITNLLLFLAISAGAYYFLFHTEKGQVWLDRLQNAAVDKLDELLGLLEEELSNLGTGTETVV
jgi:hypothetical protein